MPPTLSPSIRGEGASLRVDDLRGTTIAFCASGGLDSCTVTHWLTERGVDVVSFTADLGQNDESDLGAVARRMRDCGASEAVVVPLRREMGEAGILAIQAQARYEGGYWNTTPLARLVTVRGIIPHLLARDIGILSHGSTGRGNDQVRFQLATSMLAPEIEVYAPWRDRAFLAAFGGREEMMRYCIDQGLPVNGSPASLYSTDANLLGLTHEAGSLESLSTPAHFVEPQMGVRPIDAPEEPESVTIRFEAGRPVAIDSSALVDSAAVFEEANERAGRHGVGINLHLVENRFVGVKSRGVYEAPGMEMLGTAYGFLLQMVLDRRARRFFDVCSSFLAEQVYQGYGEDLATRAAWAAVKETAALVTGTIEVDLYKGNVSFVGASDVPHSLYVEEDASMSRSEGFDHEDSEGFVRVLQLGARAVARRGQATSLEEP